MESLVDTRQSTIQDANSSMSAEDELTFVQSRRKGRRMSKLEQEKLAAAAIYPQQALYVERPAPATTHLKEKDLVKKLRKKQKIATGDNPTPKRARRNSLKMSKLERDDWEEAVLEEKSHEVTALEEAQEEEMEEVMPEEEGGEQSADKEEAIEVTGTGATAPTAAMATSEESAQTVLEKQVQEVKSEEAGKGKLVQGMANLSLADQSVVAGVDRREE